MVRPLLIQIWIGTECRAFDINNYWVKCDNNIYIMCSRNSNYTNSNLFTNQKVALKYIIVQIQTLKK